MIKMSGSCNIWRRHFETHANGLLVAGSYFKMLACEIQDILASSKSNFIHKKSLQEYEACLSYGPNSSRVISCFFGIFYAADSRFWVSTPTPYPIFSKGSLWLCQHWVITLTHLLVYVYVCSKVTLNWTCVCI